MKGWTVTPIQGVEVRYEWGPWEVVASWPERSRRDDVTAVFRIVHRGSDPPKLALSPSRINILSPSTKNSVVAAMRKVDKEDVDVFMHGMCDDLFDWFRRAGETVKPPPRQRQGDRWLLYPVWPSTMGTVVAAATNTFKSMVGVAVAAQAACGTEILQGNTRPNGTRPILFCDWESDADDFAERLYAILRGVDLPLEPCVPYRHLDVPLTDAVDSIAEEVARQRYGGVIIDSLSAACGGSLVDDDLANKFWSAVSRIRVPVLVTAHKSALDVHKNREGVFGSVMHKNRPRMVWDARRDGDSSTILWEVTNDNVSGRKGSRLAWDVQIDSEGENETRRLDRIRFKGVNPNDVSIASNEGDTMVDKMVYALVSGGDMTTGELATAVGHKADSVRTQLNRHGDLFSKNPDGIRWGLGKGRTST